MDRLSLQILRKKLETLRKTALPFLISLLLLVCSASRASGGSEGAWAPHAAYIIEPPPAAGSMAPPPPGRQNNITLMFVVGLIVCVAIFSATYFIAYRTIFVRRGEWNPNYTYRARRRNMGEQQLEIYGSEDGGGGGGRGGGLAASLLSSFPIIQYSSAMAMKEVQKTSSSAQIYTVMMKECAVCLCEFAEGEEMKVLPVCRHAFHKACIDMWLFSHMTCPICRLSLLVKQTEDIKHAADRTLPSASTAPPRELHMGVDIS